MSSDEDSELQVLLIHGLQSYDIELVEKVLEAGANCEGYLRDGTTPIHLAAVLADPAGCTIVSRMLDYGADPNIQTSYGLTPLHIAAMWGRVQTVNVLLDGGADISIKDDEDLSALDYAENTEENRCECIDALTRYRAFSFTKLVDKDKCNLRSSLSSCGADTSLSPAATIMTGKAIHNKENFISGQCGNFKRSKSFADVMRDGRGVDKQFESSVSSEWIGSNPNIDVCSMGAVTSMSRCMQQPLIPSTARRKIPERNRLADCSDSISVTLEKVLLSPVSPRSSIGYAGDLSEFLSSENSDGNSLDETFWSVRSSQRVSAWSGEADSASSSVSHGHCVPLSKTLQSDCDSKNFATPSATPRRKLSSSALSNKRALQKTSSVSRSRRKRRGVTSTRSGNRCASDYSSSDAVVDPLAPMHDGSLIGNLSCVLKDDMSINSDMSEKYRVSPTKLACESTIDYNGSTLRARSILPCTPPKTPTNDCLNSKIDLGTDAVDIPKVEFRSPLVASPGSVGELPTLADLPLLQDMRNVSDDGGEAAVQRRRSMQDLETVSIDYDWMDVSHQSASEPSEDPISVSLSILTLTDKELRERLISLGECPGPVSDVTRSLYQRHLAKIEKNNERPTKAIDKFKDFPPEMRVELENDGSSTLSASQHGDELELEMAYMFVNPEKHTWREGSQKTSFNYLLLDPRVTRNLPKRAKDLNFVDQFRCFTAAIFYIGKGKKSRPYEHLYESLKVKADAGKPNQKVNVINNVWEAGFGVVSVHVYHSIIPVEAYTREACMIEAMGLARLCNAKRGDFYGPAATWSGKKKRLLGIYLIQKALKIYILEGERQIRPEDLAK